MRKLFLSLLLLIGFISLMAKDGYQVNYTRISNATAQVEFTLGDFNLRPVNLNGTAFTQIQFPGKVTTMDAGFAELPFISAAVQLNPMNNVQLNIIGQEYQDFQLDAPLVPSRGVIYRDQDPSQIPYVIAPESIIDAFYPETLANSTEPFIIKDVRGTSVFVYPFQYNAVQQILRVYTSVTVELVEDNSTPVNPLYNPSGKLFREMEALYHSVFINYQSSLTELAMEEAGDILVITTARDESAIQPFIDWKMEKGYNVFKEVVSVGTNVKTLVQQKYNENNSILYVQLVGDWADIKCDLGGGANAPMDPMLGCVVGTDAFPDIAIGRFSATSAAQVTTQVNKLINYEKNPSGAWYSKAISVASSEGAGIGDDGEIDYQHTNIIYNNKLDPFTYDGHSTAYEPSGTILQVKNAIEAGASIINYCGHGSMTSWGTTGFSNTNVNQLTNGDMLPFIFSVACVNGAFHSGECFAEAWLKKENGGAVLTLMATINQPWQPPMRGQDYFNDLLTGGYDYATNPGNGISTTEGRSIMGSIVVNGLVLMYTEANSSSDLQTIQTWTIFGDPSMQIRTAAPAPLTLSSNIMLVGTPFETTITSNGTPVEGAMVALSQNGVYASAYSDASGAVSVPNEFLPGDVLLVVTAFNTETIYENIQCIPPTGPYVIFDSVEINDVNGNNNGQLDYGETSSLNVSIKNVGVSVASNVQVTISSTSEYVTILNGTANYGNVPAGEVIMLENAFSIQIAEDVPNGQGILFNLTATGEETWESSFSVMAYAGIVEYIDFHVTDPNGNNNNKLDPGETVNMFVVVTNSGNSDATNVIGTLASADPYITISQAQMNYGTLTPGQEVEMSFTVTASETSPAGHMASFNFEIAADLGLTGSGSFSIVIGQIPVLIIDMDGNHNSANKMTTALDEIGLSYELVTAFPANLDLYSSIFVCLGIYSSNHQLTATEGTQLASYLNNGGRLYMEGGDTWYYDTQTAVHTMFGIDATGDGSGDLSTVTGLAGTFTAGMSFPYNGDNAWIDRLSASAGATLILQNSSPVYGTAVAYSAGAYSTIGASHEFGGLNGDRKALMEAYLDFFGMMPATLVPNFMANVTEGCEGLEVQFTDQSIGATSWSWTFVGGTPGTSAEQNPVVVYNDEGAFNVTLEISDGTNTTSMTKNNYIHVMDVPGQAGPIIGEGEVTMGDITDYHVEALDECTLYNWVLTPEGSGELEVSMNFVTIHWSDTWNGSATLKVCGGNDCGMGPYSEDFTVIVADPTGIAKIDQQALNIYPNPSKGLFVIELTSAEDVTYQLAVVNLLGIDVLQKTIEFSGSYNETIDISALPEGVYYLYLRNEQQSIVRKLIVQK
ncbi:MAG: T9SS type A sorting domain-containing protein [Bacteroidales bacterium]|nr:T9SS type A sorting domain-containing protein [Bacteroidales bacterium]